MNALSRRTFLSGAGALILLGSGPGFTQTASRTLQMRAGACSDDATKIWDDDRNYDLRIDEITGQTRRILSYLGDIVEVSKNSTPSLIRDAAAPASNVAALKFDVRKLELEGSLALSNASIEIVALEFCIGVDGRLSLNADTADAAKVTIVAESIDLPDEPYLKPISVYPTPDGKIPKIQISAAVVKRAGKPVGDTEAVDLLWQSIGASDELDEIPADGSVIIAVGQTATNEIHKAWNSALWPAEVYSKALRFNTALPFDCGVQKIIGDWADRLGPILAQGSLQQAAAGFPLLAARVAANVDTYGHGPSWAPRKALTTQLNEFEGLVDQFKGGTGKAFSDDLIEMISSGFKQVAVDDAKLEKLRQRHNQIQVSLDDLDRQINDNMEETRKLKIAFQELSTSISNAKERIKRSARDEQKRLNDAATAKQGFGTVGAIVGTAASFFVGPAGGAAIATGLQTVGNVVYAHNTSGVNPKSLVEIVAQGKEFYDNMQGLLDQWEKVKDSKSRYGKVQAGETVLRGPPPAEGEQDKRKPYTKSQAAQDLGFAVLDFGKAYIQLAGGLQTAVPQPLKLTEKEDLDPGLQELLEQYASNQTRQSQLMGELQGLIAKKDSSVTEIAETDNAIVDLTNIKPQNDLEWAQWTGRARYIWLAEMREIVRRIYILQRAFFFETGRELPLRSDITEFPSSLTSLLDAGAIDVLAPGTKVEVAQVRSHLQEQRKRIIAAAGSILSAARAGVDAHLAKNQDKVPFERAAEFRRQDADPNRRAFIESLNAQIKLLIARQRLGYRSVISASEPTIVKGSPAADHLEQRRPKLIPLYIPFLFAPSVLSDEQPLRFVKARVASVKWAAPETNVGDDGIEFTIIHPGYGLIRSGRRSRFFDLRENDATNEVHHKTTAIMLKNGPRPFEPLKNVLGQNYYTYYPAVTDYFLAVEITSNNWRRPPILEEMTIAWEVFQ